MTIIWILILKRVSIYITGLRKMLLLFNMTNVSLFLMTTAVSVVVFAVFYTIVYRITSGIYYSIVSGDKDE